MQVKISQAVTMITKYIRARLVPMLVGSPGCGKSQIVHQIADDFNLKVIDLRLSQCDPCDLLGFPNIVGNKAGYVPMNTFPIEGDPIPEGYTGWMLFLDEFNGAAPAVQAAAYKLVLDRMVGIYHLHKNVAICCAGNLETDNAIVQPMSTALQSRMVHMELIVDVREWTDWASSNGIDHRITSYINFKPGNLYTFRADHSDNTYACPRTWEFANRVLGVVDEGTPDLLPMLAGTLSEGIAREFVGYCKIFQELPTIAAISDNPEGIKMPNEPSVLFAMTGAISHNASTDNFESLMKFVSRMPVEFQVVCVRDTVRRNKNMLSHPAVQKWVSTSAAKLF
jgi:hypothetical protein